MKKFNPLLSGLLLFGIIQTGCVTAGKYKELEETHKQTSSDLSFQTEKNGELETLIADLETKLGKASTDKSSLKKSVDEMKTALKEMTARRREAERRINEYKKLVRQFKKFTDAGDLEIRIVDGRMVVGLPSDVLFKSGSAKLSSKGGETIESVSKLLTSIQNRQFQVEGHTDNVPIKTSRYASNWDLASARAINVVNTMVDAGMPVERISAASFADTRPVLHNESKENRKANRRIEIVIVPDLTVLPGYDELKKMDQESEQKAKQASTDGAG